MIDYNKRLAEVDEILSYLSEEDLNKIPEDIRQVIKENKDKDYVWNYDESKELKEQGLCRDTIIILSYLNMEYLLNEKQKEIMRQIHEVNERKEEEKRIKQYPIEDLFKEKEIKETEKIKENSIIEYKESFFTKLINKIKSVFKIKK